MSTGSLARRSPVRLRPDPARVVAGYYVAGQELVGGGRSRLAEVVDRVLGLDEEVVASQLADLRFRFGRRHRDLDARFSHHADRVAEHLDPETALTEDRWLLLGATFTNEIAVEAAALCNPSMVLHPDQEGLPSGAVRFVMTVRGIGEGHRSSIGFRVGTVLDGNVHVESTGPYVVAATRRPDPEAPVGDGGPRAYRVGFPATSALAERVVMPTLPIESNGLEDARLVRFVDGGAVTYLATYTAFDGTHVRQQLLRSSDLVEFESTPMEGPAASNKGLAVFPRRIGGRFAALSRHDRETNSVAFSDSLGSWSDATVIQEPMRPWDLVQLGNCGPPIETDDGWLVLTHGVGPMRTYSIGALLLDLDDPTTVLRSLGEPLLAPAPDEQDGYVPNVVYSCGALLHDDTLVVPYGIADGAIGFATVSLDDLLAEMR